MKADQYRGSPAWRQGVSDSLEAIGNSSHAAHALVSGLLRGLVEPKGPDVDDEEAKKDRTPDDQDEHLDLLRTIVDEQIGIQPVLGYGELLSLLGRHLAEQSRRVFIFREAVHYLHQVVPPAVLVDTMLIPCVREAVDDVLGKATAGRRGTNSDQDGKHGDVPGSRATGRGDDPAVADMGGAARPSAGPHPAAGDDASGDAGGAGVDRGDRGDAVGMAVIQVPAIPTNAEDEAIVDAVVARSRIGGTRRLIPTSATSTCPHGVAMTAWCATCVQRGDDPRGDGFRPGKDRASEALPPHGCKHLVTAWCVRCHREKLEANADAIRAEARRTDYAPVIETLRRLGKCGFCTGMGKRVYQINMRTGLHDPNVPITREDCPQCRGTGVLAEALDAISMLHESAPKRGNDTEGEKR